MARTRPPRIPRTNDGAVAPIAPAVSVAFRVARGKVFFGMKPRSSAASSPSFARGPSVRGRRAPVFAVPVLVALGWLAVAGCSSDDKSPSTPNDGSDAAATGSCASETRDDTYVAGLEKTSASGKLRVSLLDASPAPPQKGDNVWTIAVRDAADAPIDGATITMTPFMPDHGHGSAVTPVVTPAGETGKYTIDKIYLPMAGYWEMTIRLGDEQVVFGFCIEG